MRKLLFFSLLVLSGCGLFKKAPLVECPETTVEVVIRDTIYIAGDTIPFEVPCDEITYDTLTLKLDSLGKQVKFWKDKATGKVKGLTILPPKEIPIEIIKEIFVPVRPSPCPKVIVDNLPWYHKWIYYSGILAWLIILIFIATRRLR